MIIMVQVAKEYISLENQGFGGKNVRTPTIVQELPISLEVACGGYHTCVVTSTIFILVLIVEYTFELFFNFSWRVNSLICVILFI